MSSPRIVARRRCIKSENPSKSQDVLEAAAQLAPKMSRLNFPHMSIVCGSDVMKDCYRDTLTGSETIRSSPEEPHVREDASQQAVW